MTEISSLRLKHASLERENIELKDRVVGKSTGDLSYIDGSSGGNSRIWEKPPIGPERAASPAHSISVDPSVLAAAARARLGSAGSEHQHPPQRTRVSPKFIIACVLVYDDKYKANEMEEGKLSCFER